MARSQCAFHSQTLTLRESREHVHEAGTILGGLQTEAQGWTGAVTVTPG